MCRRPECSRWRAGGGRYQPCPASRVEERPTVGATRRGALELVGRDGRERRIRDGAVGSPLWARMYSAPCGCVGIDDAYRAAAGRRPTGESITRDNRTPMNHGVERRLCTIERRQSGRSADRLGSFTPIRTETPAGGSTGWTDVHACGRSTRLSCRSAESHQCRRPANCGPYTCDTESSRSAVPENIGSDQRDPFGARRHTAHPRVDPEYCVIPNSTEGIGRLLQLGFLQFHASPEFTQRFAFARRRVLLVRVGPQHRFDLFLQFDPLCGRHIILVFRRREPGRVRRYAYC